MLGRTLEELAAVGVAALSVERIARASEVNKTSVYRRWPSREVLVEAALEQALSHLAPQAVDTGSLRGDLVGLAEAVAAFLAAPAGRGLTRAIFAAGAPALAASARARLEERTGGPARAMVARAAARGEWRAEVDPRVVLAALVGALLHRAFIEGEAPSRPWIEALVALLLDGLRPR